MPTHEEMTQLKQRLSEIPEGMVYFIKKGDTEEDYSLEHPDGTTIPFVIGLESGAAIAVGYTPGEEGVELILKHLNCFSSGLLVESYGSYANVRGGHHTLTIKGLTDVDGEPCDVVGWKMAEETVGSLVPVHAGWFRLSTCHNAFVVIKHLVLQSCIANPLPPFLARDDNGV
jgi:hypothetical protein